MSAVSEPREEEEGIDKLAKVKVVTRGEPVEVQVVRSRGVAVILTALGLRSTKSPVQWLLRAVTWSGILAY